jgi:membrane-associated protease RseP (regulator of RpoE activity)
MTSPEATRGGRETHLLLVTIAVSVGVLLLLARFRFPDEVANQQVESAAAPLERLAARATYDELASIMADLERRIGPRVTILRTHSQDGPGPPVVAPRLTGNRAVALLGPDEELGDTAGGERPELITRVPAQGVVVIAVPAIDDGAVPIRQGVARAGPRYIGVMEATPRGPVVRPVYVGRIDAFPDPRTGAQLFSLAALQHAVPRGAALFTLEGLFIGLVRDAGVNPVVVPAENLRASAEGAQADAGKQRGELGIEVDALGGGVARATRTDRGVVVVHVAPFGPAAGVLQSGDVIQTIDGTPVSSVAGFEEVERSRTPTAEVAITGVRRGSPLEVTMRAGDGSTPLPPSSINDPGYAGLSVPGAGVEVVSVVSGGAAAAAGLRRGDLIVALDGEAPRDATDLDRRFRAVKSGHAVLVTVQRDGRHRVLALEKP